MDLQDRIMAIMNDCLMKQAAVAKAAGFTPKIFSDMLHRRKIIRPENIVSICKALGVSPNELFDWPLDGSKETKN